jgi:hypothetical protein
MADPSDIARPHPIVQLTLMRLRELRREPGTLFWVFGFPILMSIALGLAFRTKGPEPVTVGVLPGVSADVTRALVDGGVKVRPLDEAAARNELRAGRVALVLVPPAGGDAGGALGYRFDPMRPEARLGRAVVDGVLQRAAGRRDPRPVRDDIVRERGARYIDFLIPGLIGMNLMSGSMWGIGWVLVNMRVRKLLKRLLAAPMRRRHLFYAQALARLVVLPVSLTGSASFAGLAILVASRAQNSETVSGLMNLVMLPMFVLSGVFFSSSHFPAFMQPAINALPLTALCNGLRAVIVDGAGLAGVAGSLAVLAVWGALSFAAGLRLFRWG